MEEIFKEFNYDGITYQIGNLGTIYGIRFKRPLKQRLNKDGYLEVTLGKFKSKRTTFKVHRLVALLFVPNPNNLPEVNHKDYDRQNARWDNLEWTTHIDNVRYSSQNKRYSKNKEGIKNGRSKYSEDEIKMIRNLFTEGYSVMEIIKKLYPNLSYKERKNKHWSTIKRIVSNEVYKNIK